MASKWEGEMNEELKPCPFCGERVYLAPHGANWWVSCATPECFVDGPWADAKPDAIAKWNHRVTPVTAHSEASTATQNQTYTWLPGDAWSEYTAAMDGPEYVLEGCDGLMHDGERLRPLGLEEYKYWCRNPLPHGWEIIQKPLPGSFSAKDGELVRVPILGTLDADKRIPQP